MNEKTPTSIAASVKVIADAIKTTFGATVVIDTFVGIALILVAFGQGNFDPPQRERVVYVLLGFLGVSLLVLFILRICIPKGLGGPPLPATEDVKFVDSTDESSE